MLNYQRVFTFKSNEMVELSSYKGFPSRAGLYFMYIFYIRIYIDDMNLSP